MSDSVLLDEYHLSIPVPTALDDIACDAIKRTLEGRRFRAELRRTVGEQVHPYLELALVMVRISV